MKPARNKRKAQDPARRIAALLEREARHYRNREFIKALELLDEAAEMCRGSVKPLTAIFERKIECYYEMRRFRLALALSDAFIGKHPKVAAGYFQKSEVLWAVGDNAGAKKFRNRALRLDPKNDYYHFRAAVHADVMSRCSEAIRRIDRAIRLRPDSAEYWEEKALFCEHRQDTRQALRCFLKTHGLGNRSPWILFEIADAHYALGDYKEALKWVEKSLRGDRWDSAHLLKAKALAMLGEKGDAISELFALLDTPGPTYLYGTEWYAFEPFMGDDRFQEWIVSLERRNERAEEEQVAPRSSKVQSGKVAK